MAQGSLRPTGEGAPQEASQQKGRQLVVGSCLAPGEATTPQQSWWQSRLELWGAAQRSASVET